MGFLIDTSLWIAVERGKLSAADIHAITKQSPVFLSRVNIAEMRFGIKLMKDGKQKQRAIGMFEAQAPQQRQLLFPGDMWNDGPCAAFVGSVGATCPARP